MKIFSKFSIKIILYKIKQILFKNKKIYNMIILKS